MPRSCLAWPLPDVEYRPILGFQTKPVVYKRFSEDGISAIDHDFVSGLKTADATGQVHGDPGEVIRVAPAAMRHPLHDVLLEDFVLHFPRYQGRFGPADDE